MSTRFLRMSKAVEAALQQATPVAGLIERNRSRVLASSVRTAAVVRQGRPRSIRWLGACRLAPG